MQFAGWSAAAGHAGHRDDRLRRSARPLCELADAAVDTRRRMRGRPVRPRAHQLDTVTLAVGDALAIALMVARGFGPDDFPAHPSRRLRSASGCHGAPMHMSEPGVRRRQLHDGPRRARPAPPAAGETIVGTSFATFLGGKGFNQAIAAARAGAATAMVGRLGADDFGRSFLDRAPPPRASTPSSWVVDADAGTGIGLPLVEDSGENSIVIVPRANHAVTPDEHRRGAATRSPPPTCCCSSSSCRSRRGRRGGPRPRCRRDGRASTRHRPWPGSTRFAGCVDLVVPNAGEAGAARRHRPTTPGLRWRRLRCDGCSAATWW